LGKSGTIVLQKTQMCTTRNGVYDQISPQSLLYEAIFIIAVLDVMPSVDLAKLILEDQASVQDLQMLMVALCV
jgi:hypothetical protein